jgi:hypothetical protein
MGTTTRPDDTPAETSETPAGPGDKSVRSVPLDLDDGPDRVIEQQNASPETIEGGGEWPSADTPPRGPAPGTVGGEG